MTNTAGIDGFFDYLKGIIADELEAQGHVVSSGGLQDDITTKVVRNADGMTLQVYMRDYAQYVERGVSAERIPFSGTGGGGKSLYIEGLKRWAERKGMSNPLGAAFAIAHTHRKEGMPSRGSQRFSRTGKRTGFLAEMEKKNIAEISNKLFILLGDQIETKTNNIIANEQRAANQSN